LRLQAIAQKSTQGNWRGDRAVEQLYYILARFVYPLVIGTIMGCSITMRLSGLLATGVMHLT